MGSEAETWDDGVQKMGKGGTEYVLTYINICIDLN